MRAGLLGLGLAALLQAGCAARGGPAPAADPAPDLFRARFETSAGDFVVEVRRAWAPLGADRFHQLARAGYFDDTRFHRVRERYIAQFGIHGDPSVTARWRERYFPDDPVRESNRRGTLAYAMTGPGTRSNQIFINLADNPGLDAQGFAPFARIVEGEEVIDRIYSGYGESSGGGIRGGRQGPVLEGGNAYLDREFPLLTRIRRVVVLP